MSMQLAGPLTSVRVVEMPAIGPVPFCGMVLADLGAAVTRIERPGPNGLGLPVPPHYDLLARGKQSHALDLKDAGDLAAARDLIAEADVLLEGFRPGVMERLGLGPEPCLASNPRLVYGRLSGWGDAGPMAGEAGHDLNYLGLTGALAAMGTPPDPPAPPLNLVGDFGGAAMQLASGVLAALLHARATGQGQVVATSIYEGAAALTAHLHALRAAGLWEDRRASNVLDGGAPFYRCYAASDGGFVAVAAIEAKFYRNLLAGLELGDEVDPARQMERALWPDTASRFASRFQQRGRDDWAAHFAGRDACVTPVLGSGEAAAHPQGQALGLFEQPGGVGQPRSAARFSATPPPPLRRPP